MDLAASSHPVDSLHSVHAVLAFLSNGLLWTRPDRETPLDAAEREGLRIILTACGNTVNKVLADLAKAG